ncbi:Tetratricopeptide repeat-containing protein [Caloranaerobacter azorensis DSM 13643]|uniref:Tetratricopeptide repeat-containing protein n=1 Tax=Caloranaerobacter azorensis DSM 13643 TaxID=1121264 RepID=A0A1M5VWE3_9FIRM|nr:tetratricopeptide repeat protein [Caloranaerobacter azorensis]SHH79546.1 Tetratricopeptide repeat-containing protein [Caloranaerobacter azorensis DSM 13643]
MRGIEKFFKEKTENLTFIELKSSANTKFNKFKLDSNVPLPILVDELITEIKERRAQDEIKISSIIRGMIYTIGVDPNFPYIEKYRDILYSFDEKIEDFILYNGVKFIKEGLLDDGLIYLRALVVLNDKNVDGLYNYGVALEERAKKYLELRDEKRANMFINEATRQFENILEIDDEYPLAYYKLGYHYRLNKQFIKCKIIWEKFLTLSKDEELKEEIKLNLLEMQDDIVYEEGYNEIFIGDPVKGLEKLLPLKEKYTDWWNLLFVIGLGYRQIGDFAKAKKEFESVLSIVPGQVDALNELGLCLANLGQYEEAIEKFTESYKKRPKDYEILCNRGMTYLQMGILDKAKEDIQKAYDENPLDEITIACMKEIERIEGMTR